MESASQILVVDDTPINLELLCNAVRQLGYEAVAANSGKRAMEKLAEGTIDLVLLDYLMPEKSGLEVLVDIKNNPSLAGLPVVMVTGYYDTQVVIDALKLGAADYINKPFEFEVLKVRIDMQLQRRKMEQEMLKMRQVAEDTNVSKSRFLSFVSHELRSPLNSVVGYCDLLELVMTRDGINDYLEHVAHIKSAGMHILSITSDLLDLAQIESGKLKMNYKNVALAELVESIVAEMQPLMRKNQNRLKVQLGKELGPVLIDEVRFRQIVDNLLSNGAKYTHGGEVALTVEKIKEKAEAMLRISVQDTGIGIPRDKLDTLFREFSKVDDKSGSAPYGTGTGLGLMITRQLCEQMGGNISVASEQGAGTVFTVTLPVKQERPFFEGGHA